MLAGLIFVLSLGTISACTTKKDVNVQQVALFEDAYIYNGAKYLPSVDYTVWNLAGKGYGKTHSIGYALPVYPIGLPPKYIEVSVFDNDVEENVIVFKFSLGNQLFYVKEGTYVPNKNELMGAEFSAISNGYYNLEKKPIQFKFEDVLSKETVSETLSQDSEKSHFCVYLKNHPLKTYISYIVDDQNDLYICCEYTWHKVIDEEFKQLIMQFKDEKEKFLNS